MSVSASTGLNRSAFLRLAVLSGLAVMFWLAYFKLAFAGFVGDALMYLEPARNFARGSGIVTNFLYPAQVAGRPLGFKFPAGYLHHGPLTPLLIGSAYKLFGVSDWVPFFVTFSLTYLTGLIIYRLGGDVGGEKTALLAAGLFWSNYMVMDGNSWAPTDSLFTLFLAAAMLCLWESFKAGRSLGWVAAAGFFLGLASCSRLSGQIYCLGFLAALFRRRGRLWRAPLLFAAMVCLFQGLLMLYNRHAAGIYFYSPGEFVLNISPSFPAMRAFMTYRSISTLQALSAYPRDFAQKLLVGPLYGVNRLLDGTANPYLMVCVILGMTADFEPHSPARRFRNFTWLIILPSLAFMWIVDYGGAHYLTQDFPLLSVVAALFFWKFVEEQCGWVRGRAWLGWPLFGLLFLSGTVVGIKDAWRGRRAEELRCQDEAAFGGFLRARTREGEVIYSDLAPSVAWYAERPAVWLTASMADAEKIFAHMPPDALFLTKGSSSESFDGAWGEAFRDKTPILGFAPCAEIKGKVSTGILYRRPGGCHAA